MRAPLSAVPATGLRSPLALAIMLRALVVHADDCAHSINPVLDAATTRTLTGVLRAGEGPPPPTGGARIHFHCLQLERAVCVRGVPSAEDPNDRRDYDNVREVQIMSPRPAHVGRRFTVDAAEFVPQHTAYRFRDLLFLPRAP